MCSDLEPAALLLILDGIFTQWDALVEKHKLQKIKTIGDCFMAAGGVPDRTVDHAEKYVPSTTLWIILINHLGLLISPWT